MPVGTLKSLPAGTMPTSLHLQQIGLPGSFWPYSATLSTEEGAREYSWTSAVLGSILHSWRGPRSPRTRTTRSCRRVCRLASGSLRWRLRRGTGAPYAKAKAIESYLSETYPYRLADSPDDFVPPGRDPVDWFLFDHREGPAGPTAAPLWCWPGP